MGGLVNNRTALLAGGALVAALFGASVAAAQEAPASAPNQHAATEAGQVDFTDTQTVLRRSNVSVRSDVAQRFGPATETQETTQGPRRVEVEFAAGDGDLDVSFAQRASLGAGSDGDINRAGRGSEVRIGRGLVGRDENQNPQSTSTYMFVASDNEALTWQPGQRSELGSQGPSLQLQDRVQVGDMSVGVTYERNGVQASLAYVEREEATTVGTQTFNQNESFTGLTVTMRR
ncbi:MAG: hypothetical protein NT015_05315 [Alphaproteobacteria bacterium]|nr:hypothetical protein [Alphaproteobacteria bacterium]